MKKRFYEEWTSKEEACTEMSTIIVMEYEDGTKEAITGEHKSVPFKHIETFIREHYTLGTTNYTGRYK